MENLPMILVAISLFTFGWFMGRSATESPTELEMFNLLVAARVERRRKDQDQESVERDICAAVNNDLSQ